MKKYIPYLLKFAFMIFAIFPAIKHEWLAISMGVIALAIPLVCFVYDSLLLWTIILAFQLLDFYYEYSSQKDHKQ